MKSKDKCAECGEAVRTRGGETIDKLRFHPECRKKAFDEQDKEKYPRLFDASSRKPRRKYTTSKEG